MPAWPGGPCPDCGQNMPPNLITCQSCRALLNPDLEVSLVDIPEFQPLREIPSPDANDSGSSKVAENPESHQMQPLLIRAKGVYLACPSCSQELKIPTQYLHTGVRCNHCDAPFYCQVEAGLSNVIATYVDCPHCQKRIRAGKDQTNQNIQCEHCHGSVHISLEDS